MQKIIPHLWYDKEAKEAATFYMNLFDQSKLLNVTVIVKGSRVENRRVSEVLFKMKKIDIEALENARLENQ